MKGYFVIVSQFTCTTLSLRLEQTVQYSNIIASDLVIVLLLLCSGSVRQRWTVLTSLVGYK